MPTHHAPRTLLLALLLATPAAAQVNPSGSWRTLHTEHFRVHFRPANHAQALEAAREAERAYRLLSTELHPPRGIVDLTVSDDFDAANGFTSTYPSNRFTILLVPPSTDPALQSYDSWQRLVIVHELTHVFHLDRTRGIWSALQTVFGRLPGLFPNQYQPSWVTEGIATYYESRFTMGGRAEGSFHRQAVGADALASEARSPYDALLFTRWADGITPYAYGSRFWEYVSQTAGDSLVPRYAERTAGQLIPFRVGRPLKGVGAPRSLFETWQGAIAAAALPATPSAPNESATQSRLIAGQLRTEPVPRVSPDGGSVAYVYDDGRDARHLRVVDARSGTVQRSHRVNGQVSYDWLGDTLIVAQLEFTDRWTVRSDLWRWSPGGDWTRMTDSARLLEPRSGGGALVALKLGDGGIAPAVAPLLSAPVIDLPGATWGDVVPSPDGRWVVAPRHQNGQWQLVRWRAGLPQSLSAISPPADIVADPVWGLGGVLFVTDAGGFPQIHLWNEEGGISRITAEPLGARSPAVLADGRILFTTLGPQGWELRAVAPLASPRPPDAMAATTPFDSAPRVAVRETGYASWPSLRPYFWIPLWLDAAAAGRFVGAGTAGGDAVGRYAYFATALVSGGGAPLRAEGSLFALSNALGDPTLDFSISNHWTLIGIDSTGHVVSREQRDAGIGATFLAHRWRSFVSLRVAAEYEGRRYVSEPDTALADICTGCRSNDLVGGTASLSFGSAVSAPLAMSLQDGASASFLYRYRGEQGTSRWLNEVRARGNFYLRFGPRIGFAYPVVAARLAIGAMDGPLPDHLSVGGVSSGAAQLAFAQTIGTFRSFPVRGYAPGAVTGRRAATATVEYRVPLALVGKSLGHLPFGGDKFSLAVFGDLGDAWNPGAPAQLHRLRSFGAELVGDVTVSYDLPLRVRVGVAQPATGSAQVYGAFAADF